MSDSVSAEDRSKVLVLGSGNFGSCLGDHLADLGHDVSMWCRSKEVVDSLNTSHRHTKYLKNHTFSKRLVAVGPDLPSSFDEYETILFVVPTQAMRGLLKNVCSKIKDDQLLIFANKGIEMGTNKLPLEVIRDCCGDAIATRAVFLSGPSFAAEIVQRLPTSVSVSSLSVEQSDRSTKLFHSPHFRVYVLLDPIGVEVAGAFKNVYAIASGVASGLGFEANTRAALVTRSLAEMSRIGAALNADPLTFLSLAGVGDLWLTCSSEKSRNFTVGFRLGKGEKLDHIIETLGSTAEGVQTAKGAMALIDSLNGQVEAPIASCVYKLLYEGLSAKDLAKQLMSLPSMRELVHSPSNPSSPITPRQKILQDLSNDKS